MQGLDLGCIGIEKLTGVWSSTAVHSAKGNRRWWHCPVVVGGTEGVDELRGAEALLARVETRADLTKNDWSMARSPLDGETVLAWRSGEIPRRCGCFNTAYARRRRTGHTAAAHRALDTVARRQQLAWSRKHTVE
jgi:hypothetical protein